MEFEHVGRWERVLQYSVAALLGGGNVECAEGSDNNDRRNSTYGGPDDFVVFEPSAS